LDFAFKRRRTKTVTIAIITIKAAATAAIGTIKDPSFELDGVDVAVGWEEVGTGELDVEVLDTGVGVGWAVGVGVISWETGDVGLAVCGGDVGVVEVSGASVGLAESVGVGVVVTVGVDEGVENCSVAVQVKPARLPAP
jgi:hypothetical protein